MNPRMQLQSRYTLSIHFAPDQYRAVSILLRLCGILISVFNLFGCTVTTGLPTTTEMTAVSVGEKAIVLLRVESTIENQQPYEPFASSHPDGNISFGLGSFETGGEPKRTEIQRFLSPESRRSGWTYFVLPHGTYYLAVYPPRHTNIFTYWRSLESAPRWRIDIPTGAKLIYAGTLQLTGESVWQLSGRRSIRSIRSCAMTVADDRQIAFKLLTEHFPELGLGQAVLMRQQKGPIILHSPLPPTKN